MQTQRFTAQTHMSLSSAQSFAARNLQLLTAIENTIDTLKSDTGLIQNIRSGYAEIGTVLKQFTDTIDHDGSLSTMVEKASDACSRIYKDSVRRQKAAATDPALRPDDGVTDAYDEFIESVQALHDELEELREWIAVHDALLDPSTGHVYSSVDSLFEAMGLKK